MLNSINLSEKDYEQFLTEAIAQIPLYSQEWTNINISEPGITILENLAAFEALQQSEMNEVSEKIRWKLLALAGFVPKEGIPAITYLKQQFMTKVDMPQICPGEKIYAQNICYELSSNHDFVKAPIVGIYSVYQDETYDLTQLAGEYGIPGGIAIFGDHPQGAEMLYILVKELPETDQNVILYVEMKEFFSRNPLGISDQNPFAEVEWEVLTKTGFTRIKDVDETHQFLVSGYIQLSIPVGKENLYRISEQNAYVIRACLKQARYDIVPHVNQIQGLLTQVIQKDTKSVILYGCAEDGYEVSHALLQNGMFDVFVKEQDGQYHSYTRVQDGDTQLQRERTYHCIEQGDTTKRIMVDCSRVAKAENNNIFIVCRELSVMPYKLLDRLYGYDEQEIALPPMKQVLSHNFSIIVVSKKDRIGHVVYPESRLADEVVYSVSEQNNTLIIHDCGMYEGAEVMIGDYALYQGNEGNVLPGTVFTLKREKENFSWRSCAFGKTGTYQETFEEVRKRFVMDLQMPSTIVTKQDCEKILAEIPGLSIHKMKAIGVEGKNEIHVVMKPNSLEKFPQLSDIYEKAIRHYLENRRMLTTKIVIEQPCYVPINVRGTIYIKKHFEHGQEIIEGLLHKLLDGFAPERNFGETLFYHEIYHAIASLECVEEIYDFTLISDDLSASTMCGLDIKLAENALFYLNGIDIELSTK